MSAVVAAPAVAPVRAPYTVRISGFEGTLSELAHNLRSGRIEASRLDLLALVRDFLAYFEAEAATDLDLASEALPAVAQVIELKLRLLLPRPPRDADEETEPERAEAIRAIETLERLEAAIGFLRERRERRRFLTPARAVPPRFERPRRPLDLPVGVLAAAAARYRRDSYFEIEHERLSVPEAMRRLLAAVRARGRAMWRSLLGSDDWATRTVYFAAVLELVREGSVAARQDEPFGEIVVAVRDGEAAGDRDDGA